MQRSVLAFWTDVPPSAEDDFNEWYNREHVPERVAVPGILNGSRYRAVQGGPRYFAMYEAADADTLTSAVYRERLDNPTPWTRRIMPVLENSIRGVFLQRQRMGRGCGAFAAVLRLSPLPGRTVELESWLEGEILRGIVRLPSLVDAQLWLPHAEAMNLPTAERRLRGDSDRSVDWVLVIQGTDLQKLRAACREALSKSALRARGAAPGGALGIYRLLYSLTP